MERVYRSIDGLIAYAEHALGLDPRDEHYVRGAILDALGLASYTDAQKPIGTSSKNGAKGLADKRPDEVLEEFVAACTECGAMEQSDAAYMRDKVMGMLMLPPSAVGKEFRRRAEKDGAPSAIDWLYDYSVAGDYVKKSVLEKNPRFESNGLIVTINKAKPEYRDPKAAAKQSAAGAYPKCSICHENEGCGDRMKRTLRTVDITLGGQKWFWQYSPYGYFDRHGIAVNYEHIPMHVDEQTFGRLMDFTDMFPHFFIGSNAALPRIGGSVLAHDHYQGGGESLPLHNAASKIFVKAKDCSGVTVSTLDWRGTALRIVGTDRKEITKACEKIRKTWVSYDAPELGIVAEDANGIHNAISPTVVKRDGKYEVTIILRSNITSEKYPDGVFHAHPEFHEIKKESIGLIEAQGLFILPGRLEAQLETLAKCVERGKLDGELKQFKLVYDETRAILDRGEAKDADDAIRRELGSICARILENTAVFKTDDKFVDFLEKAGFYA